MCRSQSRSIDNLVSHRQQQPQPQQESNARKNHHHHHHHNISTPALVLITESDACDSPERMTQTFKALQSAVATGPVSIIIVRVARPPLDSERIEIKQRVMDLANDIKTACSQYHSQSETNNTKTRVVVSSDWWTTSDDDDDTTSVDVQEAHLMLMLPDGVHVKEAHRGIIPQIRQQYARSSASDCVIGTSAHSIESAMQAYHDYHPDYILVGTCYPTASHPEKTVFEGPALPGKVKQAIQQHEQQRLESSSSSPSSNVVMSDDTGTRSRPLIIAVGGIDETNCYEPMTMGADGVAVIRAVLQASDPAEATRRLWESMAKQSNNNIHA